ncbi:phosphoribosylglycinamide formyltransferase, partial [Alteromonas sp. 14N.309.X.WAT.G.H12]|uniref:phosphoribosylglycinamide formyltransferase n=1 Tax=Alteromonas sp. 14N.309.X.WAT.G.H12 TaxID=3120824 RepID=UPI002FD66A82
MDKSRRRLCVLISGNGSNLQAMIDSITSGQLDAEIVAVISNRPDAYGLTRAQNADIEAVCLDHKTYSSREQYDNELLKLIDSYQPDGVV